ncbi:protein MLN51 homolog isoform X1 [Cucurbita moschata]|uniref:Protein MLN51 homolog isoform X1 n=1 Tax=Cucurbita moschata TaxID=3662 RepID=A0A6J1H7V7_CUCMO|nr:protein MLN51 homolog isoform X1 [Cucurbita moschata]
MATATEEEVDYESDPEEAKRLLAMRRREASDDEEGEGEGGEGKRTIRRVGIHSDDSDGQGGAAEYDDEDELGEEVDEDEVAVGVEDVDEGEEVGQEEDEARHRDRKLGGHGELDAASGNAVKELDDDGRSLAEGQSDLPEENPEGEFSEEKKVNEPFAVPTAGAFYMHDDRFRDNAGGRHRRMHGGRRLWESKDDMKWGHDKFEEITLHERHRGERKTSKGHPRGRGKSRGMDHGYARGNRSRAYNKSNNQNDAPKVVRGRGPRRYESTTDNNIRSSPSQDKQSVKPPERALHNHTGRTSAPPPNVEGEPVSVRKHVFASSLNSASPPFYPSGTSSKNILKLEKTEVQAGLPEKNMYGDSRSMPQSSVMVDGRHVVDAVAMDRLYINDSTNPSLGNLSSKTNSGSSVVSNAQIPQSRPQGRGAGVGSTSYPPAPLHSQVNKVSLPTQSHGVTRTPSQNRVQPAVQVPVQQLGQRPDSGSQSSSPPKTALSVNSVESGSGEADSYSESSKLKTALVGKGKGMAQGIGAGSFIYSGAQIMGTSGNMNITHGDQNFPHTPAFLPVMQFGGQHPGGIGVPAVGMAFPGYVAQPQLGMGNSEMTWLPVLAGAAGALGATYCSPYIAVDGSYHARPSGQTSSVATLSKENNTNKSSNEAKPSQNELENDDVGQRQNKPRRYSEMNFGQ